MSFRSKFLLVVFSASLALYAVVGGWMSINAQQQQNDPGAQLRIFESVLRHIQDDYVDEPDLNKVRAGALRGLAYGLDPYSTYLTTEQVKNFNAGGQKNQSGIGAELSQFASYLYVIAPVKGGPADQAGLQPGDVISTGTPPGVGLGQKPPLYLKPGQTMKLGIQGLGVQTQRTVDA